VLELARRRCFEAAAAELLWLCSLLLIASLARAPHRSHRTYARAMWHPTVPPADAHDVSDPLYRWLSKLRVAAAAACQPRPRGRGALAVEVASSSNSAGELDAVTTAESSWHGPASHSVSIVVQHSFAGGELSDGGSRRQPLPPADPSALGCPVNALRPLPPIEPSLPEYPAGPSPPPSPTDASPVDKSLQPSNAIDPPTAPSRVFSKQAHDLSLPDKPPLEPAWPVRCCAATPVLDRTIGGYVPPEVETREPARTERLLTQPCALRRPDVGADEYDTMRIFWLYKAGPGAGGVCVNAVILSGQLILAVCSGLQDAATAASSGDVPADELALLYVTFAIPCLLAIWLVVCHPFCDRLECAAHLFHSSLSRHAAA
jgi:hypothetical protein